MAITKIKKMNYEDCDDTFEKRNEHGLLVVNGYFVEIIEDAGYYKGDVGTKHEGRLWGPNFPVFFCRVWKTDKFDEEGYLKGYLYSDYEPDDYFCIDERELDNNPSLFVCLQNRLSVTGTITE